MIKILFISIFIFCCSCDPSLSKEEKTDRVKAKAVLNDHYGAILFELDELKNNEELVQFINQLESPYPLKGSQELYFNTNLKSWKVKDKNKWSLIVKTTLGDASIKYLVSNFEGKIFDKTLVHIDDDFMKK